MRVVVVSSSWPTCSMTYGTLSVTSSRIEMYVWRSVCGVTFGSAPSPRASRCSLAMSRARFTVLSAHV